MWPSWPGRRSPSRTRPTRARSAWCAGTGRSPRPRCTCPSWPAPSPDRAPGRQLMYENGRMPAENASVRPEGDLEIRAGAVLGVVARPAGHYARRELALAAHLLQLLLGGQLLGEERGLDAVEEAFEPADE